MLYKPSRPKKPEEPIPPERIILGEWPLYFIDMTNTDGFTLAELQEEILQQLDKQNYDTLVQPIDVDSIKIVMMDADSHRDFDQDSYTISYSYPIHNLRYDQQYKLYEKKLKSYQDKLSAYEKALAAYEVKLAEYEAWKNSVDIDAVRKRHDKLLKELVKLEKQLK
jgi:hypothetical protein